MEKLISLNKRIRDIDLGHGSIKDKYNLVIKTNRFGEQKLLERYDVNGVSAHPMNRFVATDLKGNPLEKPEWGSFYTKGNCLDAATESYNQDCKQYQEALDRVLFEGFEDEWGDNKGEDLKRMFEIFITIHPRIGSLADLVTLTKTGSEQIK